MAGLWPERAVRAFGRAIGGAWFWVVRYRRGTILENLARAFPELDPAARRRLGSAAAIHLVTSLLELLRIPRYLRRGIEAVVEIRGLQIAEAAFAEGHGVLCLTGHLGSFELCAAAIAQRLGPQKVAVVVKSFPPGVDDFVSRLRRSAGLELLSDQRSIAGIFRALRENRGVVLVLDQNATRRQGVFVDFFGHPASTMSALALLAIKTGAPVLPVSIWRTAAGHVLEVHPPIPLADGATREAIIAHTTQRYTAFIEAQIRLHPEQWLWTHRRWRTRPELNTEMSSPAGARSAPRS